jgi:hypothetical protein
MSVDITAVADVIVPELFTKYSQERTADQWELIKSGIVTRTPEWDQKARDGAKTVNMPFFQDISGASEATPGDGTTSLGVAKITSSADVSAIHYRSKVWGANDLAAAMAKADPLGAISDLVGDYWAREYQRLLLCSLTGVFGAASMAAKILSYFNANVTQDGAKELDGEVFVDVLDLMGDASKTVTAVAMHSKVRNNLWKKDLIDTVKDSASGAEFDIFMGRRVIVDDSLPKVAVTGGYKYTTYLFGQGAFAYGEGTPKNPVEVGREILKRNSLLANDKILILHPRGVKWAIDAAGNTPSDVELETGTSWARVFEAKNIRIVAAVTNG